jgi:5-methylcytosine-specific restriction endonuclease McrA
MTALLLQKGTQMRSLKYVLEKTTDERISRGMQRLLLCDQKRKVDFLYYLAEADKRKLYAKDGYSSLFNWLTGKYRLSEPTALKRIQVARLAHKFPFLYRDIRQGKYTLTVLSRISKFVKGYNAHLVFAIAESKSVREVEAALVEMFPKEEVEEALRKSVSPLGLERHSVQFTADTGFIQDLQEARALLSHRFPKGKLNEVLGLALKTLLHDLKKAPRVRRQDKQPLATEVQRVKVFLHDAAITPTPAREVAIVPPNFISPQKNVLATQETLPATERSSRYIPRGIRYRVYSRDNGKCQYPRPDGGICGETHFLELDHLHPFALGGANTESNLRLSCWAHNALRAERQFGKHQGIKKSRN